MAIKKTKRTKCKYLVRAKLQRRAEDCAPYLQTRERFGQHAHNLVSYIFGIGSNYRVGIRVRRPSMNSRTVRFESFSFC